MDPTKKIEEKAMGAVETLGRVYEKLPSMKDALKLIENKETEFRLKFENLTLDGDIALSITLMKEKKGE
ncbi:MAG: hypothetical protein JSV56_02120 [Methanomassiliicoccales archaeon]|jgi:hypothetical protein|nr:MAG: hypothetical protein JSV56_02120 [Methanomassiliicoccales archaeon]